MEDVLKLHNLNSRAARTGAAWEHASKLEQAQQIRAGLLDIQNSYQGVPKTHKIFELVHMGKPTIYGLCTLNCASRTNPQSYLT